MHCVAFNPFSTGPAPSSLKDSVPSHADISLCRVTGVNCTLNVKTQGKDKHVGTVNFHRALSGQSRKGLNSTFHCGREIF